MKVTALPPPKGKPEPVTLSAASLVNGSPRIAVRRKAIGPYLRALSMDPDAILARSRASDYRARERVKRDPLICVGNTYLRSTTLEDAIPMALAEMEPQQHSAPLDDRKASEGAIRHIVEEWLRSKKSRRP